MDITLRQYLESAEEIHNYIEKSGLVASAEIMQSKVIQLQKSIRNIQTVAKRMADIANMTTQIIKYRDKKHTCVINKQLKPIDPYPGENDHVTLRIKHVKPDESQELIPGAKFPVKFVEKAIDIPVGNLYYVTTLQQYAININGIIIKGNLANIGDYKKEKTAVCDYGTECKQFKEGKECGFYHNPEDYISNGLTIPHDHVRNFTVGSWLYSETYKKSNYYARHVGGLNTLERDLTMLKKIQYKEEINTREGQLIHDLIIYFILHNKGFLCKYPIWE